MKSLRGRSAKNVGRIKEDMDRLREEDEWSLVRAEQRRQMAEKTIEKRTGMEVFKMRRTVWIW